MDKRTERPTDEHTNSMPICSIYKFDKIHKCEITVNGFCASVSVCLFSSLIKVLIGCQWIVMLNFIFYKAAFNIPCVAWDWGCVLETLPCRTSIYIYVQNHFMRLRCSHFRTPFLCCLCGPFDSPSASTSCWLTACARWGWLANV